MEIHSFAELRIKKPLTPVMRGSISSRYALYEIRAQLFSEELYRAVALIIHRYGRVSRVESLNEHWLAAEARLRTDFNMEGI